MTDKTLHQESNLPTKESKRMEEAWNELMKANTIRDNAHTKFMKLIQDSKYEEIEFSDPVVDAVDYNTSSMTFKQFIKIMDELLEKDKRTQDEINTH